MKSQAMTKASSHHTGTTETLKASPGGPLRKKTVNDSFEIDESIEPTLLPEPGPVKAKEPNAAASRALNAEESKALKGHEKSILLGRKSFLEVGGALTEINTRRLYRDVAPTFEKYCRVRWDFSSQRANQLMHAADIALKITTNVEKIGPHEPESEGQLRPLTRLADPNDAPKVWNHAAKEARGAKVTAKRLEKAIVDLGLCTKGPEGKTSKTKSPDHITATIKRLSERVKQDVVTEQAKTWTDEERRSLLVELDKLEGFITEVRSALSKSHSEIAPLATA